MSKPRTIRFKDVVLVDDGKDEYSITGGSLADRIFAMRELAGLLFQGLKDLYELFDQIENQSNVKEAQDGGEISAAQGE